MSHYPSNDNATTPEPDDRPVRGVSRNHDGTWTALTYAQSKTFKTERGAREWYARKVGQ